MLKIVWAISMLNVQCDRTCSEEVGELPARVAGAVITVAPGKSEVSIQVT